MHGWIRTVLAFAALALAACQNVLGIHQLTASDDGGARVDARANALVVTLRGNGSGRVRSQDGFGVFDGRIDCPGSCMIDDLQEAVTLRSTTENGSDSIMIGFSGDCDPFGAEPGFCRLTAGGARQVFADFVRFENNLVFVSSESFPTNLGGLAPYDAHCNRLASAAGINDLAGGAFIAWMSTASEPAASRLMGARGFVRRDGRPFVDRIENPNEGRLHTVGINELGGAMDLGSVMTGTADDGSAGLSCGGWSLVGPTYEMVYGDARSGGPLWTETGTSPCEKDQQIYCVMRRFTQPLVPVATPGKLIYLSLNTFRPWMGIADADLACNAVPPSFAAGKTLKALLGTTTQPAAARLDFAATYVRPDGQVVGTGAEIAAGGLRTGIWQVTGPGYVSAALVATGGGTVPEAAGSAEANCNNWQNMAGAMDLGNAMVLPTFWQSINTATCSNRASVYCIEQ